MKIDPNSKTIWLSDIETRQLLDGRKLEVSLQVQDVPGEVHPYTVWVDCVAAAENVVVPLAPVAPEAKAPVSRRKSELVEK